MSHLVGDLKYLLDIRVQESWRAIFRPATECVIVAVGRNDFRSIGLLGVFRTVLVLCFRLPSSGPGTRFRPRRECDTLGLSEDEYDCISARSTRQYRSSPCPSLGIPSGTLSHS